MTGTLQKSGRRRLLLAVTVIPAVLLLLPLAIKQRSPRLANFAGASLEDAQATEVEFHNARDATSLAGLWYTPKESDSFPAVVIIHGSGNSRRSNRWYQELVQRLQRQGIAVLLPDKRGCDKSNGDWVGVDLETLATDTEAAIAFVRQQAGVRPDGVGIVGVSQGGWIAPIVASRGEPVAFVVDVSGTTATCEEQLRFEEFHNISPYTWDLVARCIAPLTTERIKRLDTVAPFVDFDPVPYWKQVDEPVFFAFGEGDTMCPTDLSVQRIKDQGLRYERLHVYPSARHGILSKDGTTIRQDFIQTLVEFISSACAPQNDSVPSNARSPGL